MPRGVTKPSQPTVAKSTRNRKAAVLVIETIGVIVMPCSFCESRGLSCKMARGYQKCKECTRRGRSCDGNGISLAAGMISFLCIILVLTVIVAERLAAEKERIDAEERQTEQQLLLHQQKMMELTQSMNESFARLSRLREQRQQINVRGEQMLRRGAQSLDELDDIERAESEAVVDVQLNGGVDVIDWNAVLGDFGLSTPQNGETSLLAPES